MAKAIISEINGPNFPRRRYGLDEKQKLLDYLKSARFNYVAAGYVRDCVTGKETRECIYGYNPGDLGDYSWSSWDIYHIEHYDAKVTDEFFEYVMGNPGPILDVIGDEPITKVVCL